MLAALQAHARTLTERSDVDPPTRLGGSPSGLGITGMRERAAYAGGTATVTSAAGRGTRVWVELPWKPSPWTGEIQAREEIAADLGMLDDGPVMGQAVV